MAATDGQTDVAPVDYDTAARLFSELLFCEESELRLFLRRNLHPKCKLDVQYVRAARDVLRSLARIVQTTDEDLWSRVLAARDPLADVLQPGETTGGADVPVGDEASDGVGAGPGSEPASPSPGATSSAGAAGAAATGTPAARSEPSATSTATDRTTGARSAEAPQTAAAPQAREPAHVPPPAAATPSPPMPAVVPKPAIVPKAPALVGSSARSDGASPWATGASSASEAPAPAAVTGASSPPPAEPSAPRAATAGVAPAADTGSPAKAASDSAKPRADMKGETCLATAIPEEARRAFAALPFRKTQGPNAEAAPNERSSSPGSDAQPSERPEPSADAPGQPAPAAYPIPTLTLEQYASLCAEAAHRPGSVEQLLVRWGLRDAAHREALDRHWQAQLSQSSELRARWESLVTQYRGWLETSGR